MFSSRVPGDLQPNRLTMAIRRASEQGRPLLDLTLTNPTVAGIPYPSALLQPLGSDAALRYAPSPFGLEEAREAVALEYRRRGIAVALDRVVLTASTSEAYSFLFKLLCEPGDAVLVPVPSYPLFDHLTRLDGIRCIPYRLEYDGRWAVELDHLDAAWLDSVRAVLAVSPNNPTGSVLTDAETGALSARCATRGAALVVDEVFADYPLRDEVPSTVRAPSPESRLPSAEDAVPSFSPLGAEPQARSRAARESRPAILRQAENRREHRRGASCEARIPKDVLSFRLGGLSKSAGLPQVKLGWIVVDGPERLVAGALERLEIICDAYLSVSTSVQVAAPALIEAGGGVRGQILSRIRENYRRLGAEAGSRPAVTLLAADAGWSAVLRVPATRSEEDLVVELLEREGVLVHPGFFFDFDREAYLVVSLLPEPDDFAEGVRRVMERADA